MLGNRYQCLNCDYYFRDYNADKCPLCNGNLQIVERNVRID